MENSRKARSRSCEKDDGREKRVTGTMIEIFSIEVRKARVGAGYGTSDSETLWSNVWACTDGWNTWLEEAGGLQGELSCRMRSGLIIRRPQ